ncbi:28S ribosomal protein S29, mitochondrial [Ananas comosus]|uniref:Small ribosomal subunit protein mS29 n=1 Tax=Ananas comosus TaxID=4615 RepID=A0A199V1C8_ANACO|nr:28S ribosomal protein S29, mitochondrial [Ananas comosus]
MLLRSLLRSAAASSGGAAAAAATRSPFPRVSDLLYPGGAAASRTYAKAKAKAKAKTTAGKGKVRAKDPRAVAGDSAAAAAGPDAAPSADDDLNVEFELPTDPLPVSYDPSLDVGPGGRPLFSFSKTFSPFSHRDARVYVDFSLDEWKAMLPEGLPVGMMKEFEETRRCAVMVRESFLDLRDNFRRIADPPITAKRKSTKKQIVLDGPVSCGKSVALAMLVHWARSEGWLVFYVPKGKEWTHGGFFYRNPYNDLWDTPVQAARILQDFLKFNESHLQQLPCQIFDPIPLGEGAGVGMMKGVDSMAMPEGSTLYDLIQTGITYTHAATGVVVRLRKELSLVKDVPVLFAIDQYNNWFTFSEYQEPVTVRSCRPIHARELSMVNAYRSMMHDDMMIGVFSNSTAVGKLRQELPDVPLGARVMFPRYNLDEAATVCHYYLRQKLIRREGFSEEKWKKIYYLSNGNGSEMRWLAPFI